MAEGPDFWNDPQSARKLMQERTSLENQIKAISEIASEREDLEGLADIAAEEGDEAAANDVFGLMKALADRAAKAETEALLSGEADKNDCYFEIHPGAGGTESNDWAAMLLRMYLRWAQKRGYDTEIIEQQAGEEAGVKSASVKVSGFERLRLAEDRIRRASPGADLAL